MSGLTTKCKFLISGALRRRRRFGFSRRVSRASWLMHPLCCRVSLCSLAARSIQLCAALSRRECINNDKLLDGSNFFSVLKSGASLKGLKWYRIVMQRRNLFIRLLYYPRHTHVHSTRDSEASDIKKITALVGWKCDSRRGACCSRKLCAIN